MQLGIRQRLIFLLQSSRPLLWPAVLLPFLGGNVLSARSADLTFWLVICFLLWPFNFVLYAVNDYFDTATDAINPRKHMAGMFAGLRPGQLLTLIVPSVTGAVLCISLPILYVGLGRLSFALLVLWVFVGIAYSAPPFRFKERPPLDSLVNGLLYFGLPFLLGWSLSGSLGGLPWVKFWSLVVAVSGFHVLAGVLDYTADARAGVRTIVTVLGIRPALLCAAGLITCGFFAAVGYTEMQIFLSLTLTCVVYVLFYPSEAVAKKLGYYCVYPGFIAATIVSLLQVLGKF